MSSFLDFDCLVSPLFWSVVDRGVPPAPFVVFFSGREFPPSRGIGILTVHQVASLTSFLMGPVLFGKLVRGGSVFLDGLIPSFSVSGCLAMFVGDVLF